MKVKKPNLSVLEATDYIIYIFKYLKMFLLSSVTDKSW